MQISKGMSCILVKYYQSATTIDLERMVLTMAPSYSQLLILSIQSIDLPVSKLNYRVYQKSNWYEKIVSFFPDSLIALDNLSFIKKKTIK